MLTKNIEQQAPWTMLFANDIVLVVGEIKGRMEVSRDIWQWDLAGKEGSQEKFRSSSYENTEVVDGK